MVAVRLLRLLALLQARRFWPGAELASRLSVAHRTLRRDVERLRELGYRVDSSPGAGGGYQLNAAETVPPLLFDEDEAVAAVVGLRTAAAGAVSGIGDASLRALAKLERVLPERLRDKVRALDHAIVAHAYAGPAVSAQLLQVVAGACRDRRRLAFRYESRDQTKNARCVEPLRLVQLANRWYLVAWDRDRDDWRTFRLDRIRDTPLLEGVFPAREPPAEDLATYVSHGVAHAQYRFQARVLLHAPLQTAAERIPPTAGALEAAGEDTCVLHAGASHSFEIIAVHLAAIGFPFEILDPPELAEHTRRLANRLLEGVAGSGVW